MYVCVCVSVFGYCMFVSHHVFDRPFQIKIHWLLSASFRLGTSSAFEVLRLGGPARPLHFLPQRAEGCGAVLDDSLAETWNC